MWGSVSLELESGRVMKTGLNLHTTKTSGMIFFQPESSRVMFHISFWACVHSFSFTVPRSSCDDTSQIQPPKTQTQGLFELIFGCEIMEFGS